MLYLDSLTLHNFKSFKQAQIKFNRGFNCIVGPNGSGKSNICDSLLFALGEGSLRRMRVTGFPQLIKDTAKVRKDDTKRAFVRLQFSGDESIEITRIIKSNNKVGYRLNGRSVKRQDVLDALRKHRSMASEINSITQGEINEMLSLTPRERRQLIDVAAGIREFNDKKDAALRELEKVEARIGEANVLLRERQGFISELEHEKEAAERYSELSNFVKAASYTMLKATEAALAAEQDALLKSISECASGRKALESRLRERDVAVEGLSAERAEISDRLNKGSIEVAGVNRILEELNREIAVMESQKRSTGEQISAAAVRIGELKEQRAKLDASISENEKTIGLQLRELEKKDRELAVAQAGSEGKEEQMARYAALQKGLNGLMVEFNSVSNLSVQYAAGIKAAEAAYANTSAEMSRHTAERESVLRELEHKERALSALRAKMPPIGKRLESIAAGIDVAKDEIDSIYKESVSVRERLAVASNGNARVAETLKKGAGKGVHGRVSDLCTYEDKYALAVHAAAGSRMNYFVVDSPEVAQRAIDLLRDRKMGRASFIPLDSVSARQAQKADGLEPMIQHLSYERAYASAFNLVFSNTYLVDSIAASKRHAAGKYRFVTLAGELVEPSGVITGGFMQAQQSAPSLEAALRRLESRRDDASARMSALGLEQERARKELAALQTEELNASIEAKHLSSEAESLAKAIAVLRKSAAAAEDDLHRKRKEQAELISKKEKLEAELGSLREGSESMYAAISGQHGATEHRRGAHGAGPSAKQLREEAERLRISIATARKENELHGGRKADLLAEAAATERKLAEMRESESGHAGVLERNSSKAQELRDKIKNHDSKSKSLYERFQAIDQKVAAAAAERGRNSAELERLASSLIGLESRKASVQTRMGDIKAELLSYQGQAVIEGKDQETLSREAAKAKAELELMGMVNMKAPEMYSTKKGELDQARERLAVLDGEKASIMDMINEIESKKLDIFFQTFNSVNDNFQKLYSYVFDGSASLAIEDKKDPFGSGLAINITSAKNKGRTADLLSGGEKSLLLLMLVFSIQMCNPMSFYIFDEIDAALDKENSKKLSTLIKELSKRSQIVVVSHNDSLMTAADTAIGVVHRGGESQVVGIQLSAVEAAGKA